MNLAGPFKARTALCKKEMRRVSDLMKFMLSLTRRRILFFSIAGLERPA
jgi:hypothetical protein